MELLDETGAAVDRAATYAGLRSVGIDGQAVTINGQRVFQRLVLDQGYYPDGVMTAPTDADLVRDIELSLAAGFNGARLHQKVFEERFLYHADRLGYLVWGEFPDWGSDTGRFRRRADNTAAHRVVHHPVAGGDRARLLAPVDRRLVPAERDAAGDRRPDHRPRRRDPRDVPCRQGRGHLPAGARRLRVLASGARDRRLRLAQLRAGPAGVRRGDGRVGAGHALHQRDRGRPARWSVPYTGQPYFCSEFGGIWWSPSADAGDDEESWGYGVRPATEEAFYERFDGLVGVLLDDPRMFGYCYTQLTDVHQEQNGVYRFDRSSKLDVARMRAAQVRAGGVREAGGGLGGGVWRGKEERDRWIAGVGEVTRWRRKGEAGLRLKQLGRRRGRAETSNIRH